MPATKSTSLPQGLPAHLCAGDEGYRSLCTLLGITTTQAKQDVVKVPAVRRFLSANRNAVPRHGRTAERLRHSLLALYGDPVRRTEIWRAHSEYVASGGNGSRPIPSLERAALSAYDDKVLTAEPDTERLTDCAEFHTDGHDDDGRRKPALAALPQIRDDFSDWTTVPDDRKPRVIAAAFAVASLLDDPRILHWAAECQPAIREEYSFLNIPEASEAPLERAAEPPADEVNHEPSAELQVRANALSEAASDLVASEPSAALFDVLTERYNKVLELRDEVLAQTNATAIGNLLDEFSDLLEAKAEVAPWLAEETERLLGEWRGTYPPAKSDPEAIRADVYRAVASFDAHLSQATDAKAEADRAQAALDQHIATGAASRAHIQRQIELRDDANTADRAFGDAVDAALAVLAPEPTQGGAPPSTKPVQKPDDHQGTPDSGVSKATDPEASVPSGTPAEPTPPPESSQEPTEASPTAKTHRPAASSSTRQAAFDDATTVSARIETAPRTDEGAVAIPERSDVPTSSDQPTSADAGVVAAASVDGDLRDNAEAPQETATETPDSDELSPAQATLWRAVGDGRLGLAYHIARLDGASQETRGQLTPELLAAVALGTVLASPHDDLANAFAGFVGPLGGLSFDDVPAPPATHSTCSSSWPR